MTVYLLTFELSEEDDAERYELLWTDLRRKGAQRVLKTAWIVDFDDKPEGVRDHVKSFLSDDDRLSVAALVKGGYTYTHARSGTNDWLVSSNLG